jgi:DNA primase
MTSGQVQQEARDRFQEIFERYSTSPIQKKGWGFVSACPIHNGVDETHFSWSHVSGSWSCWSGPCGVGRSPADFIMEMEDVTFPRAILWLSYLLNLKENVQLKSLEVRPEWDESLYTFSNEDLVDDVGYTPIVDVYNGTGPIGKYVREVRKIPLEVAQRFSLGAAHKGRLMGRVVIPVPAIHPTRDAPWVGAQGRQPTTGGPYTRYLNYGKMKTGGFPVGRVLYNWARCPGRMPLLIVEGPFCCMRAVEYGWEDCVALMGGYLSTSRLRILSGKYRDIILALDYDKEAEVPKTLVKMRGHLPGVKIGVFPPNERLDIGNMGKGEFKVRMLEGMMSRC